MTPNNILIVEDDEAFATELTHLLTMSDLRVDWTDTLDHIEEKAASGQYDLIILDQFVRGRDAVAMLFNIQRHHTGALLILSGNQDETDRILALEMGADDFVCKTQRPREILARIRAVLRRVDRLPPAKFEADGTSHEPDDAFGVEQWLLDEARRDIRTPRGEIITLTALQYDALVYMATRRGQLLSRAELYRHIIRRPAANPLDRTLDNLISRLRRDLTPYCGDTPLFKSVRGQGYVFIGFDLVPVKATVRSAMAV